MVKYTKYLIILLIVITTITISNDTTIIKKINTNTKEYTNTNIVKDIDTSIGYIRIDKININNKLYDINDSNNTVEKNIETIISNDNLLVLAAHSGTGSIAYFNELNKLDINDEIIISINDIDNLYHINKIYEIDKDGSLELSLINNKTLILTTCSTTSSNKQLVIEAN